MTSAGLNPFPSKTNRSPRGAQVALVAALFLVAAAVSYLGTRYQPGSAPDSPAAATTPADPVVRIDLPHEDFPLPPGPHRERFQVNCTICHSPRLAFTQAPLPEQKWQEVVHKMVAVYGAPLGPDEERQIVSYLSTVHGPAAP